MRNPVSHTSTHTAGTTLATTRSISDATSETAVQHFTVLPLHLLMPRFVPCLRECSKQVATEHCPKHVRRIHHVCIWVPKADRERADVDVSLQSSERSFVVQPRLDGRRTAGCGRGRACDDRRSVTAKDACLAWTRTAISGMSMSNLYSLHDAVDTWGYPGAAAGICFAMQ